MPPKSSRTHPPSECPVCGVSVKPNARACPECGADERSGWNEEESRYDGLDLPAASFDEKEAFDDAPTEQRFRPRGVSAWWWIVGIALLLIIISQVLSIA